MKESARGQSTGSSLWHNNSVLVQLLGLSPLLAVSSTLVNGIGLGMVTLLVTLASCVTASMLRVQLGHIWRVPYGLVIVTIYTTLADLLLQYAYFPLYRSLGIYIPLICCNAAILVRLETYSRHVSVSKAFTDGFQTALGFVLVLSGFSAAREWLSTGTLFANSDLLQPFLLDQPGVGLIQTSPANAAFDFPTLPAGAFILFGLLLALKNLLDSKSDPVDMTD